MLWLTIAIALLLALLAIGFVVWPLWQTAQPIEVAEENPLTGLIQRKDAVMRSIKELEFDYQTGKLSVDDYTRMDQRLRQQAISFLRQLEKAAPASASLEAELEAAILRQRQITDQKAKVPQPETTETAAATSAARRFCAQCGAPVMATDNFCARCGATLRKADITADAVQ